MINNQTKCEEFAPSEKNIHKERYNQKTQRSISQNKKLRRTNQSSVNCLTKRQMLKLATQQKYNPLTKYTPIKDQGKTQAESATLLKFPLNNLDIVEASTSNHKLIMQLPEKIEKRHHREVEQYYKFWKNKANDYQNQNFDLQRIISGLEQELQILKHHNHKLQRKLRTKSPEPKDVYSDPLEKQKLQKYYGMKINSLSKKIEEQEIVIQKQDLKIRQLSKQMSENHKLKDVLQNMEDRISQKNSDHNKSNASSKMKYSKKNFVTTRVQRGSNNLISHNIVKIPKTYRQIAQESKAAHQINKPHQSASFQNSYPHLPKSRSTSHLISDLYGNKNN